MTFGDIRKIIGLIALFSCFAAGAALAQQVEPPPACAPDIKKHCAAVVKGGGAKIIECLKANDMVLTPACKLTVTNVGSPYQESPCKLDIEKLCPTLQPGGSKIVDCLRKNQATITPECKNDLGTRAFILKDTPCRVDVDKIDALCSTVAPGAGRLVGCMRPFAMTLTAGCRTYSSMRLKD
ncbi:exported hypothetical protein [Azospirillaceae bacterium]